jgi:hypothetical protein
MCQLSPRFPAQHIQYININSLYHVPYALILRQYNFAVSVYSSRYCSSSKLCVIFFAGVNQVHVAFMKFRNPFLLILQFWAKRFNCFSYTLLSPLCLTIHIQKCSFILAISCVHFKHTHTHHTPHTPHTHKHTRTQKHTPHTHKYTQKHTHTNTHKKTHTQTHTHKNTHKKAYAHKNTHKNTHTHHTHTTPHTHTTHHTHTPHTTHPTHHTHLTSNYICRHI